MNALRALTWTALLLLVAAAIGLGLAFDSYGREENLLQAGVHLAAIGIAGLAFSAWLQSRK